MTKKKTFIDWRDELCSEIVNCNNAEQIYAVLRHYLMGLEKLRKGEE